MTVKRAKEGRRKGQARRMEVQNEVDKDGDGLRFRVAKFP